MAGRTGKGKRKRASRKHRRFIPLLWIFQIIVIILCLCTGYLLWLDHRIQNEFEGKRWSLPARVYARPMEIYTGQNVSQSELERYLSSLNYKKEGWPRQPGQYLHRSNETEFILRPFHYWDGWLPARHLRVLFQGEQIAKVLDGESGALIAVARLEPQLIGKIYPKQNEDRVLLPYNEVPQFLIDALIASEDRHFFRHFGMDIRGILRALWVDIRSGHLSQGGSTLTQQLVKNFFLTRERTLWRKINEIIMAVLLERRYTKAEILSAYINEIYLGQNGAQGIHGFGTAAEFYFGKPLSELRDDQIALLVGLVRGASYYNPRRHPQRALTRRNLVLELMQQQGFLGTEAADKLKRRRLDIVSKPGWSQSRYPAFLQLVRQQLLRDYKLEDLQNEGMRIFTTLEVNIQEKLEQVIKAQLSALEQQRALAANSLETASIIIDISSGEVLALAGGRDKSEIGFNRVLDAKRPIGSLIKPFIYLTALTEPDKFNLLSVEEDVSFSMKQQDGTLWQPQNYDNQSHGSVSMLEALVNSYNLATVKLGMQIGLNRIRQTLKQAGVTGTINPYPSLLLGSLELSPFEVAQMYQTLANGGFRVPLNPIREVLDNRGEPLQRYGLEVEQALDPDPVFLTNYLLTQVVERGTARQLHNVFPKDTVLAGKTGTTNDSRDSWYVGYSQRLLGVTWLGRDDNRPTPFTGASGAMQLWAKIMRASRVESLELVASDEIAWMNNVKMQFKGECAEFDPIPFIKDNQPKNQLPCSDNGSSFNPLRWFQ